jgi:thiamine-phosphate pyrophosphorylase
MTSGGCAPRGHTARAPGQIAARLKEHASPMASPRPTEPRRPVPRLYLVTPPVVDPAHLQGPLESALAATDVAAILLTLAPADERTMINHIKVLAPLVQDKGMALLLDNLPELVARAGADGIHLAGVDDLKGAIESMKPDRIVGAGQLKSRHEAMSAGEGGVDYVLFGEPDAAGRRPAFEAVIERVEWWAEIFEIPCVGFAATLDEVTPLVTAGADFVALSDCIWNDPRGPAAALAAATDRLMAKTVT